jgi:hypothetical protein
LALCSEAFLNTKVGREDIVRKSKGKCAEMRGVSLVKLG